MKLLKEIAKTIIAYVKLKNAELEKSKIEAIIEWKNKSADRERTRKLNFEFSKANERERKFAIGNKKKTYVDPRGYSRFTDSGKLVHRWVAKKKNRYISSLDVHHIDGNKLNNNQENLVALTRTEHEALHKRK